MSGRPLCPPPHPLSPEARAWTRGLHASASALDGRGLWRALGLCASDSPEDPLLLVWLSCGPAVGRPQSAGRATRSRGGEVGEGDHSGSCAATWAESPPGGGCQVQDRRPGHGGGGRRVAPHVMDPRACAGRAQWCAGWKGNPWRNPVYQERIPRGSRAGRQCFLTNQERLSVGFSQVLPIFC